MTVNLKKLESCRACHSQHLNKVIDFNHTGIADDYFKEQGNEGVYPLACLLCHECGLLQLEYVVDASAIYDNYIYVSTSSPGLDSHFKQYAESSAQYLSLTSQSKVLDIGCNDGMLLKHFEALNCQVFGIEPSVQIAHSLNEYGIQTYNSYLNSDIVEQINGEVGKFNLVTSNNVFANVDDILSFANNVVSLLEEDGVWIVETGYHYSLIENFVFDNIYHEHLSYFSVTTFQHFFDSIGLALFHVEKIASKGGSIRVYAGFKNHVRHINHSVNTFIEKEKAFGLFRLETYHEYMQRIHSLKEEVQQELKQLVAEGKKVVGFGASATVTTVISVLGIAEYLTYLVDDNPIKHNTYSPEYRLSVYPTEKLNEDPQAIAVILPWRFADMIIEKNSHHLKNGGHFVKIMPQVEVI